jgi:hypothetical protein
VLQIAEVSVIEGGGVGIAGAFWLTSDMTRVSGLGGSIDASRAFNLDFVSYAQGGEGAQFVGSGASGSRLEGTFTDVSGELSGRSGCAAHAVATK